MFKGCQAERTGSWACKNKGNINMKNTGCACGNELPRSEGSFKEVYENILENSFIPQPGFAFGATLALFATLASRKFTFNDTCSNLYILNIGPSGHGKDVPQKKIKEILINLRADSLLGAGDYVSDAALVDGLALKPVRLDILDEAGGILRAVNSGKSDYNGKMADILAELYTSSNTKYLGRQLAEGTKGECYRPNVNILASTTPTGFQEGVSRKAIEKGLLGRFLIFTATLGQKARRRRENKHLDATTMECLQWILSIKPENGDQVLGGIRQNHVEIAATEDAHALLDKVFETFDEIRCSADPNSVTLPIVSRLFQQMVKIVMVYAVSRTKPGNMPKIEEKDVLFGYKTILYFYKSLKEVIEDQVHEGHWDHLGAKLKSIISGAGGSITKSSLAALTRNIRRKQRDEILTDLAECGDVSINQETVDGRVQTVIRLL